MPDTDRPKFDASIVHPRFGTLYLKDVRLRNGRVDGMAMKRLRGANTSPGLNYIHEPMNFSINCIQKVHKRE